MKHKKLSVFHLDWKESALACSSKKQKRVEILLLACFSFLSFLFLGGGVGRGALQGLRGCRICRTIPAEPATQWSQSWPRLVPVCTPRASSSNMLLRHLKPSTKWMIAIIKLPFNYSSRCQWCAPLWHYNGLRLPRKCRETQGTITLSKCSLLVTLFPVHQLIFQVKQQSEKGWLTRVSAHEWFWRHKDSVDSVQMQQMVHLLKFIDSQKKWSLRGNQSTFLGCSLGRGALW